MQKNEKGPLSHQKIKCSFLDYVQLLMIAWAIWAKSIDQNVKKKPKKGPLSHQKIKCSFLDYVQLLMINRAIPAKNVNRNTKKQKGPLSHRKVFTFGLHSTSDDRPSNLNKKHQPKCKKNEKGPLSHPKIKCSFLDYVQLLMINRAIRAKNVNRNTKKTKRPPKSSKSVHFWITFNFWWSNKRSEKKMSTEM